ncbi:hypothetical protein ASG87_15635 [Frateuria sp. Soil773]|nr:hypothetical protein ASG87_15635 [Frateuria sp. Soil773]
MHLRRSSESIQIESAVPRIEGVLANAKDFIDDLVDGFSSAMRLTVEHKVELQGLLSASSWHSRQIYRNTYVYFLFLAESTHPSIASKEDGFAELMTKLVREHSVKPFLSRTFDAELEQMYAFDVPLFLTRADETAAYCGTSRFDDYFTMPVMSDIYRKIDSIGEDAIDLHVDFLRRTYAAAHHLPLTASGERAAVRSIADTLASRAILGASDGSLTWMYSPPVDASSDKVAVTVLGPDLYSGMGGMLWFISEAAYALGDATLHALCEKVRSSVCMHLKQRAGFYRAGAMTGYQGLVWALAQDALRHGNHRDWMLWKRELCSESFFEGVVSCDVVDGLAGCVLQLLALHEMSADQDLLERAGELVRRVLAHSRIGASSGLYWEYAAMQRPLLGFGHGGAGIAFAINAYAGAIHDEVLQEKVVDIFNFEDQYFNEKMGLWPDLRIGPDRYTTSWCNGLAGHVQARLHCYGVLTSRQREITLMAAEKLMFYAAEGDNDSLCHGTLGTVEVLREAAIVLKDPRFSDVASDVIDCISQRGVFRSGWSTDQANPGVMVGISGYGMTKLRMLGVGARSPLTFMIAPRH